MNRLILLLVLFVGIAIGGLGLRGYQRWKRNARMEKAAAAKQAEETLENLPKTADTLKYGVYNLPDQTELSHALLAPYLEEQDLETTENVLSDFWRYRKGGLMKTKTYTFSTKYDPTQQEDPYWFKKWEIIVTEYDVPENAVRAFNKILSTYAARRGMDPVKFQGDQTRKFLAGKYVFEVNGGCDNQWFVKDAAQKLVKWCLNGRSLMDRTLVESECGG